MTVDVEFDSNSILSEAVIEHNETDNFGDRAIEMLPGDILEAQSVESRPAMRSTIPPGRLRMRQMMQHRPCPVCGIVNTRKL